MKTVIVDERISEAVRRALMIRGFNVLELVRDSALGEAVSSHPDTVLFRCDNQIITTAEYCDEAAFFFSDLREYCPEVKISFSADCRGKEYPRDCIMNALVIGDKIFAKSDTLSDKIKEFAADRGMKICHVKQGYPACSTLALGNTAITADKGMAKALMSEGIDVTLIREGGILLDGCEYGFIGGASGVCGDKVYFIGDVLSHPDGEIICDAVRRAGYKPISLSSESLTDRGGLIFI